MIPPRRPTAFRLDEVEFAPAEPAADSAGTLRVPGLDDGDVPALAPRPLGRGPRWGRLFTAGLGGLVTIALGLAVDGLIREAFSRADWLGWLTVGLAILAVLALVAFSIREVASIFRLNRIATIQKEAAEVIANDDRPGAVTICNQLTRLYGDRPETAHGRAALVAHLAEIIDGPDLVALAEHELLHDFDAAARRMVLGSAQRVSLVTAISPRALLDVAFVLTENIRLMRRIAFLYGGRPGTLGFFRLARSVVTHLALTGGMAAGESMVQQIVGHGLAARLSARLGEGLVNGMLTARVGLAAISVCRPLPFLRERPPRLSDILADLAKSVRSRAAERKE